MGRLDIHYNVERGENAALTLRESRQRLHAVAHQRGPGARLHALRLAVAADPFMSGKRVTSELVPRGVCGAAIKSYGGTNASPAGTNPIAVCIRATFKWVLMNEIATMRSHGYGTSFLEKGYATT
jgi:hypothetical protein